MSSNSIDWLKSFIRDEGAGGTPDDLKDDTVRIGKYQVISEIGRGGTSIVYKAFDPGLSRPVALKVLRDAPQHPVLVERLHREATAAAKLRHPNIVAIHETGTILRPDGGALHFIAMDYVEGRNLAETSASMTPDERLRALLIVAETVAFAHQQGIVHRDLKPENILIDKTTRADAGFRWHVWLTDFGLAKIIGGEDLTRTGAVVGTPHSMSPEQVRGRSRETGPATDVWALGVMLYEILCGRRPFDGETALEIYEQIVRTDPIPPRRKNPELTVDLETLILKSLEKDPTARYPDAGAFAEDLSRCLRDEPISTRPASLGRKVWRTARKDPLRAAFGVGLTALLFLAILLAAAGRAERKESLEAFRDQARLALDAALALRRAGANAKMREFLPPLEEAYRKAVARAPDLAEVDYLIGRMYRALLQDDKALEYQEAALRKDPSYAPALYEHAVLSFKNAPLEAPESAGEESRLRDSVIRGCTRLLDRPTKELNEAQLLVARAMLAFGRGQPDEARKFLEDAARADPLLDEVWQILGRAARLGTAPTIGDRERKYRAEEESYNKGLERDKGYLPYLIRRGRLRVSRGHYMAEHGRDPTADFDLAEQDLNAALDKDPSSVDALWGRAQGRLYRAVYKMPPGADPLGDYAEAEKDADALTRRPAHAMTWMSWRILGDVFFLRGRYLGTRGRDPSSDFSKSKATYLKLLQMSKGNQEIGGARACLGQLLFGWASHAWRSGQDPEALFKEAEDHFARSVKILPDNPWNLRWRATGLVSRAEYMESRGRDPFTDYALAEDDLIQTIRGQKDMTSAWKERAQLHFGRGAAWEKRGEKERARREFSASAQSYLQAFSLNPALQVELGGRMAEAQRKAAELGE
jgi:tetratricopeptide (TPR) repeat protein/predicted Ser/Thr protein kinase